MDRIFGLDQGALRDEGLALLETYFEGTGLSLACGLLADAGIPYLCRERGAGGITRLVTGHNMFGTDVYVREQDLDAATALLTLPEDGETEDAEQ